jgi:hypothetical protein
MNKQQPPFETSERALRILASARNAPRRTQGSPSLDSSARPDSTYHSPNRPRESLETKSVDIAPGCGGVEQLPA